MNNSHYLDRPIRSRDAVLRDLIKTKELYFIVFDDGKELLAKEWPIGKLWEEMVTDAANGQLDDVFAILQGVLRCGDLPSTLFNVTVDIAEAAVNRRDEQDTLFDEYGEVSLPSWIQKHAADLIASLHEHYEHEGRKFVKGAA